MGWMAPRTRPGRSQAGFTLAGLIVVMTILMIFIAYTVPRQWSTIMQRERERQTIFIMKQYARAIAAYGDKNGGNAYPASMEQLTKAQQPRFLRGKNGEYIDPLTGQVDWLIIPLSAAGSTGATIGTPGGGATTTSTTSTTGTTGTNGTTANTTTVPAIPMKDYAGGPFIGVRPPVSGKSLLELNGSQNYEGWSYTVNDYRRDRDARKAAAAKVWQ